MLKELVQMITTHVKELVQMITTRVKRTGTNDNNSC